MSIVIAVIHFLVNDCKAFRSMCYKLYETNIMLQDMEFALKIPNLVTLNLI